MRSSAIRNGQLIITEKPQPSPGPGQVLVKNLACGICGSDLHIQKLLAGFALPSTDFNANDDSNDLVLGHEFCSEIIEYGPNTKQTFAIGQRVCAVPKLNAAEGVNNIGVDSVAPGAYSEFMLLDEHRLLPVPDELPSDAAALTEPFAVAIHAINSVPVSNQDSILVLGSGPIGLAIIAVLKSKGINNIIATDLANGRREFAEQLGAAETIDPTNQNPFDALNTLRAKTGSETSIIFECVGTKAMIGNICTQAPERSRIVIAGVCTDDVTFNPFAAMSKELSFHFVFYYEDKEFEEALAMIAAGSVPCELFVSQKIGLDEVADTFEKLRHPDSVAKVVIEPWR